MRRLNRPRRTSRPGRHRQPLQIQSNHQSLAINPLKINIRSIRHSQRKPRSLQILKRAIILIGTMRAPHTSRRLRCVGADTIHPTSLNRKQLPLQPIPQRRHLQIVPALQSRPRQLRRCSQSHNPRNILRPRPPRPLMPPAMHLRLKLRPLPDIKRPHSLRPMQLMRRKSQQIASNLIHSHTNLPRRLHRVRVKINVGLARNRPNLPNRLHHPGFIIRHHDRDQPSRRPQRPPHILRVDHPTRIHRHISYRASLRLQPPASIQNRVVLNRRSDNVIAIANHPGPRMPGHTKHGQVIRFRPAAGKHYLRCPRPNQRGHALPSPLHRPPRLLSMRMNRRGIPKALRKIRPHRLQYLRQHRSSGVVVEINSPHHDLHCTGMTGSETCGEHP